MRGKKRILRYAILGALTCLSGAALPGITAAAGTGTAAAAETATAAETAAAAGKAAVSGMSLPASPAVTEEKPVAAALPARSYDLDFDSSQYEAKSLKIGDREIKFRAYENIVYVKRPALDTAESMSIYVPEAYFEQGGTVNGYTKETAPIFLPNGVGGYMPGSIAAPSSEDPMSGGPNASLVALSRGCVVAAPAIRGRTTQDGNGVYVGKAPALIVDDKAAVRYLRYNRDRLPAGDTEKIISDGTSAGGALSALLGATGNSPDYEPYLSAIGAADERDDIFASMDYCPITNLEHADMAYEWIFSGVNEAYQRSGKMMMPPAGKDAEGAPAAGAAKPAEGWSGRTGGHGSRAAAQCADRDADRDADDGGGNRRLEGSQGRVPRLSERAWAQGCRRESAAPERGRHRLLCGLHQEPLPRLRADRARQGRGPFGLLLAHGAG
jgi:acetyl esterase/lipase